MGLCSLCPAAHLWLHTARRVACTARGRVRHFSTRPAIQFPVLLAGVILGDGLRVRSMSVADSDSSASAGLGLPARGDMVPVPRHASQTIWLDGEVLACACPKCGSPMSVRLWLLVADCWRCGTSVELTEEQEQQALALLRQRATERGERPAPPPAAPARPAAPRSLPAWRDAPTPEPPPPRASPSLAPRSRGPAIRPGAATPPPERETTLWQSEAAQYLLCWLISLLVHMLLIILLGTWLIEPPPDRNLILALEVNALDVIGAAAQAETANPLEFDDPGGLLETQAVQLATAPESLGLPTTPVEESLEPDALHNRSLPELPRGPRDIGRMLAGRDPRLRQRLVESEGGTIYTEAAVARGLEWLARHQNSNGSWSLDSFSSAGDCNGRCRGSGRNSDMAGTALALLPFLGAGQTQLVGQYREAVGRGLRFLMDKQRVDGDLRYPGDGQMYAQGLAAIALCEAYALTKSERLKDHAQRALDFIVRAQHSEGGWRYEPGQPGDTSIVGWQLMALRSGQMAYLRVPDEVFHKANRFLDRVQTDSRRGLFAYMPGHPATPAMTAEGLLSRQYSGWRPSDPRLQAGLDWLLERHPPRRDWPNIYYWYYATQAMHHVGGERWQKWNSMLPAILVDLQETEGHEAGSWTPRVELDPIGGRLYMTALAVCTLEVYYRHLPLYGHEAAARDEEGESKSKRAKASRRNERS